MISLRFKDKRFLLLLSSFFPSLFHKRTAFTLRIDRLPAIPTEQSMPIPFPVHFKSKPLSSSSSSSIVSEEKILAGLVTRQIFIIYSRSLRSFQFPPNRTSHSSIYFNLALEPTNPFVKYETNTCIRAPSLMTNALQFVSDKLTRLQPCH